MSRRVSRMAVALATWFGCGLAPVAPGTAGSLGAIAVAILLDHWLHPAAYWWAIAAVLLSIPAIWAADRTAAGVGKKDPGLVVVDEVVGQWITLAALPSFYWLGVAVAFFLFRLLDIVKPWPARRLESLPGGFGIVADDAMAGLYGALVLLAAGCFNLY
ncbi:MAG: phosphatidylglycerophosphatase A [Bryobacteraceae bacterium]|nr:phosphatidylglycerophosphatase A [Bryobacteraceae bacterium]